MLPSSISRAQEASDTRRPTFSPETFRVQAWARRACTGKSLAMDLSGIDLRGGKENIARPSKAKGLRGSVHLGFEPVGGKSGGMRSLDLPRSSEAPNAEDSSGSAARPLAPVDERPTSGPVSVPYDLLRVDRPLDAFQFRRREGDVDSCNVLLDILRVLRTRDGHNVGTTT